MIHPIVEEMLTQEEDKLFIPAEKVAILEETHTLAHALLVLTHVQYALIPVVDRDNRLVGEISLSMVLNAIVGLKELEFDLLNQQTVASVMRRDFPRITRSTQMEDVLNLLIDTNFLCIVDQEDHFVGIVTRKEILKRVNYMVHNLQRTCQIIPKTEE